MGTPVYRRHLLIFIVLGALGSLNCVFGTSSAEHSSCVGFRVFFDFLGVGAGLMVASLPWLWGRRLMGFGWQRGTGFRKDPLVPLILVADPHWHDSLLGLEEARSTYPGADWLFLGDLFDVWVGVPGSHSDLEQEFLAWVKKLRSNGAWVGLWLGNREFFLDYLSDQFDLMGEGAGGQLIVEGLCWEHGDLVDGTDWRYRIWALLSRSGIAWVLVRVLPKCLIDKVVDFLKLTIRSRHDSRKLRFPDRVFTQVASTYRGKTFITGHFHIYRICGNGISLPWAKNGKFMVWYKGNIRPLDSIK